jgi:hypothetical protein
MKVVDIATSLGISSAYVSTIATKNGFRRQARKGCNPSILGPCRNLQIPDMHAIAPQDHPSKLVKLMLGKR